MLTRSVFIHTPKTGGQWVAAALENAGLITGRLGVVHASPDEIWHEPEFQQRPFVFAMVRHPLTWYQSMWAHRMDEGWDRDPIDDPEWFTPRWIAIWAEFTRHCKADTFDEFVHRCVAWQPTGYVSMLYDAYTQHCTFVARQESLVDDLLTALQSAGEPFEPEPILRTPKRNVRAQHSRWLSHCRYTPELIQLVMRAEEQAILRFGYRELPELA